MFATLAVRAFWGRIMRKVMGLTGLSLAFAASAAFGQATIEIGSREGSGSVDITLATGGLMVAYTENVIAFGPENQLSNCAVNDDINRPGTAFFFRPRGCKEGVDCETMKALLIAFASLAPLPDGVVLYTCDVTAAGPPGDYPLTCSAPGATDPFGNTMDAACSDGTVTIPDVPLVNISVGSATIEPGGAGEVDVTLELLDSAAEVTATENEIAFGPEVQLVNCEQNPDINREASAFSFSPSGCAPGVDCESMKALILSFSNLDALPDGTRLYTCNVLGVGGGSAAATISGAASDTFPLNCSAPGSSDPAGAPLSTSCSDGRVDVVPPTATQTPTSAPPTPTSAPPTPTSTPEATATATSTDTPIIPTIPTIPPGSADDDGCAVAGPEANDPTGVLLMLPLAALLWLRRTGPLLAQ